MKFSTSLALFSVPALISAQSVYLTTFEQVGYSLYTSTLPATIITGETYTSIIPATTVTGSSESTSTVTLTYTVFPGDETSPPIYSTTVLNQTYPGYNSTIVGTPTASLIASTTSIPTNIEPTFTTSYDVPAVNNGTATGNYTAPPTATASRNGTIIATPSPSDTGVGLANGAPAAANTMSLGLLVLLLSSSYFTLFA